MSSTRKQKLRQRNRWKGLLVMTNPVERAKHNGIAEHDTSFRKRRWLKRGGDATNWMAPLYRT